MKSADAGAALVGAVDGAVEPPGDAAADAAGLAVAWVPPHAAKTIADTASTLTRRFRI
jgi:hypothetical protein